jgi:cold shock CspA family protein
VERSSSVHPYSPAERTARGSVSRFDEERGLGTVTDDTGADLGFHCTAIADGTRQIEEGTRVVFEVTAGHMGRWEATAIRADTSPAPAPA